LQPKFSVNDEKLVVEMAGLASMVLSAQGRDQRKVEKNERIGDAAAAVHSFLLVWI
jgi:hypothetical protein